MGWHILAGRGETSSALVKYLSNRVFHSREWRRETAIGGIIVEGNATRRRRHLGAPRRIPFPFSCSFSIFIRKISREGGEDDDDDPDDEVQSRFYCPLLEGGLSTFLCPAEIHGARKCLLKISTSVASLPLFFSPLSLLIGSFVFSRPLWSIFPLDSVFRNCRD